MSDSETDHESDHESNHMSIKIGWATITSVASRIDYERPVYLFEPRYTRTQQRIRHVVRHILPRSISRVIQSLLRWLFLPEQLIVKQIKHGHEHEFACETQMYRDHPSWWGTLMPSYYGTGMCMPYYQLALLIGVARGTRIDKIPASERESAWLKLKALYTEISKAGVMHADPNLEHTFISENGAMLIDWGLATLEAPDRAQKINMLDLEELEEDVGHFTGAR